MKFGLMSLDYKRLPLEESFRLTEKYSFDGLEIFGSRLHLYPYDLSSEKKEEIINLKSKYSVEVPMYTPNALNLPLCICSTIPEERRDGVDYYKKALDVASAIGAERLLVVADHPGYHASRKKVWKYLVDSMKEICEYSLDKGVQVHIEPLTPMESPVINTVDDCVELLDDVNSINLYAMMDIVPPIVVQEPFSKYFQFLGDRLNYIHVCNTDGVTDAHFQFDHGILNMVDVFQVIKDHKFEGYVTAEIYSELFRDPDLMVASIARNLSAIKKEILI